MELEEILANLQTILPLLVRVSLPEKRSILLLAFQISPESSPQLR